MGESRWLTAPEAAEYLNFRGGAAAVNRYRRDRGLPGHKIPDSNEFRYHPDELDEWVRSGGANETAREGAKELNG